MDWQTILTSLGGTAALLAAAAFLAKKWIGVRIEESVRHEYAKELEEHKAQLQEQARRVVQEAEAASQELADARSVDKALFQKLLAALPSTGGIRFVRDHPVGSVFEWGDLRELLTFEREWSAPEHEFLDEEFEEKRKHLRKCIALYLDYLATNTWPVDAHDRSSIPAEWKIDQPDRFAKTVDEVYRLAGDVVAAHDDLVRTGRGKFKC